MAVTKGWIESVVYSRGVAVTARQLAILGLSWPPQSGWKNIVDGKEISDSDAARFEEISIKRAKKLEAEGKLHKTQFRPKPSREKEPEDSSFPLPPSKKPEDFPGLTKLTFDDLAPADLSLLAHRRIFTA